MYNEYELFSDRELICRVWDIEEIRDLMARRVYYYAADKRRDELAELWVSKPQNMKTASFGRNWGYYVGMDEIAKYYVVKHDREKREHIFSLSETDASIENTEANLGMGCMAQHPVTTSLVELAQDGETARGLWYSFMGQEAVSAPGGGAKARWQNEKVAADFIQEDGKWKIWHLVIATDYTAAPGENHADIPALSLEDLDCLRIEFGEPTIPIITHDPTFNWWDNYPPEPQPYYAFSSENSYGPEGHPALKEESK